MRILVPTLTRPHIGGAYTLLRATGRGLRRRGHEVVFVSLFGVGEEPPLRLDLVKRSDRLLSGVRGYQPQDAKTRAIYWAARAALAARIALVTGRARFDAAFTVDAGATNALRLLRDVLPLPTVFDVAGRLLLDLEGQGKIQRNGEAARWFLGEERRAYESADVVLAYPASFAEQLRAVAPAAPIVTASTAILDVERIRPVNDPAERGNARRRFGIPDDGSFVVLVPSRLVARKGVVEAVGILGALTRGGARNARLVFAGEGPEEPAVRRRATELGVADRVHVLGGVPPEQMNAAYGMADCIMLPAVPALGYEEPQGLTTFEALAAQRPVVASDLGGIPEVILNEVTGLLAPPGDEAAFAAALRRLMSEPQLATALVAGGSRELERRLAADAHFLLLEGLFAQARARRHHARGRTAHLPGILAGAIGESADAP